MQQEHSHTRRYLMAFFAPLAVAALMQATWPFFARSPISIYLLAVVFSAWYGGLWPGLISVAFSFLLADYFFVEPYFALWMPERGDLFYMITLVTAGPLVSVLSELMHRARRSAEERFDSAMRGEGRFRAALAASPNAMVMVNAEGRIILANAQTVKLFGYTAEELRDKPVEILVPERFRNQHPVERVEFFESPHARPMGAGRDLKGRHKDGREIPVEIGLNPMKTDEGMMVIASIIDISERVRAEKSLRESEERLQTVIENLTEGLVISTLDGQLLHWNHAGLEMHGFKSIDEGQLNLPEFTNLFELSTLDGRVLNVDEWPLPRIFGGEHMRDFEVRIRRLDGSEWERIFSYGGSIVHDASGRRLAFVTINDITERKLAEERLRKHAQMLDLAPVLIRDLRDRIVLWTAGTEQMYGWTAAEVVGKNSHELLHTELPCPLEEIKLKLFAQGHWEGELTHMRRDGERIVVASRWVLHRNERDEPRVILEVNNDITERKRAEEQVHKLNEELELRVADRTAQLQAANKELEAFSYSVSHDLRAPLRHINGFSQALLEDYSESLDEIGKGYLEEVRGASRDMAQLIDDVINLARVTRTEMRREVIDLSELARDVVADLKRADGERDVAVHIEGGLTARGDKRLLHIVLTNLLSNAWKFSSKRVRAEISFGKKIEEGETVFFVSDNGAGFDMAYADKLFRAFQRLHSANVFEGTGVGLATVQRIINRHGGRVWAEGEVGRGAIFYFTLPALTEGGE